MGLKDFLIPNKTFFMGYVAGILLGLVVFFSGIYQGNEFNPLFLLLLIIVITSVYLSIPLICYLSSPNKKYVNPPKAQWGGLLVKAHTEYFYDNGFYGEFSQGTTRLFKKEFKKYTDIKYICLYNFKYFLSNYKKGIHIETNDNKILNVYLNKTGTQNSELVNVIGLLKMKCGLKWEEVYDNNRVLNEGLEVFQYHGKSKSNVL